MRLKLTALITTSLMISPSFADSPWEQQRAAAAEAAQQYGSSMTAASSVVQTNTGNTAAATKKIAEMLLNLGYYLGYNLLAKPSKDDMIITTTPDLATLQATTLGTVLNLVGSVPLLPTGVSQQQGVSNTDGPMPYVGINNATSTIGSNENTSDQARSNARSSWANIAQNLNMLVNGIYAQYKDNSGSNTLISPSPLIDQSGQGFTPEGLPADTSKSDVYAELFANNPTAQAIQNLLTTPSYSYCSSDNTSTGTPSENCKSMLVQPKVVASVIGSLPNANQVISMDYNKRLLPQLNANNLLSPLMYSTQNQSGSNTGTGSPTVTGSTKTFSFTDSDGNNLSYVIPQGPGLTAGSQAQVANNFVRYLTGQVAPMNLADNSTYSQVYTQALTSTDAATAMSSANALMKYLMGMRTYAAQASVGISNIYYILGRRVQNTNTGTSQAASEYLMATRRLYNPNYSQGGAQGGATRWMQDMQKASPAVVQREMVYLLAEINYQLYLNRLMTERLLLSSSSLQLQTATQNASQLELRNPTGSSS